MTESTPNNPDNDLTLMDELEDILDDLRTRAKETPHAEFCEGFLAALVCCRRVIPAEEYLEVLLEPEAFADAAQRARFMELWQQRWQEVQTALDTDVDSLEDDAALLDGLVADGRAIQQQFTATGGFGAQKQLQKGGFTAAGGADYGDKFAAAHRDIHALQHAVVAILFPQIFGL